MKKLLLFVLIGFLILACNNRNKSTTKLTQLLAKNTEVVIQINNISSFKSDVRNNPLLQIPISNKENRLNSVLQHLEYINTTSPVLAAFANNSFSLITKYHDSLFSSNVDSLSNHKIIDSILILSPDKDYLELVKVNKSDSHQILELNNTNSSFSIFLDSKKSSALGNVLFDSNFNEYSDWIVMDSYISTDQIGFNGICMTNDSLSQFANIFKGTIPQENRITNIAPINNRGVSSFTYDDFNTLQNNLTEFNKTTIDSTLNTEILETFSEIGSITLKDNNVVLVANSIDAISTNELLKSNENKISSYRNIDIHRLENASYFESVLKPLVSLENNSVYINIDDFFVFATNENSLEEIIINYQNGTTLNKDQNFLKIKEALSDESSLLNVSNPTKLQGIIYQVLDENIPLNNLSNYKYSGFQLVQDDGFVHLNGVIKKSKTNAQRNSITEAFNVSLDADLLNNPQFVTNHRTKQKEIVVQDINNNLYLISNKGKILWKKQLRGPVLGKIEQVDLYRNGRLQLAFATPKRIYILDRNGKDVAPFPLKFNNTITQPLSVFDYDNNKDYRFAVTQNNIVIMYNRNGKRVNGFKYQNSNEDVITQPKHFRINGHDYIVFATASEMKILNRRGQSRVIVNEKIDYSGNAIFRYNNSFTTTASSGELIQVNLKGNVSKQSLNLADDHYIYATSKTLTALSENKLTIKHQTQELDFGNYTAPKIFYLNDKIYINVTDLQSQKIYLFDSQSKSIRNFPVYGNSTIDLANIDNDGNLEFVTKGESNSVIVYQKN